MAGLLIVSTTFGMHKKPVDTSNATQANSKNNEPSRTVVTTAEFQRIFREKLLERHEQNKAGNTQKVTS